MKIFQSLSLFGLLTGVALCHGCYSVRLSNEGGRQMCTVENSCLKILGFIPVGSGDIDSPYEKDWVCFEDTTTLFNNIRLVERAMEKTRSTGILSATTYRSDEQVIIFLLKRSTLHTSVELTKNRFL